MGLLNPDPLRAAYPPPPRSILTALRYCRNPLMVRYHFRERAKRSAFVAAITGAAENTVQRVIDEIERDYEFHRLIMGKRQQVLGRSPNGTDWMILGQEWRSCYFPFFIHYAMVRLLKPEMVVEIGSRDGIAAAFMLRALDRNGKGTLITLDPSNDPSTRIVPDTLKAHHRHISSNDLEQYPQLDIVIHDGDHAYKQVWPNLKAGGVLYSAKGSLYSVFEDFAREVGLPSIRYDNFGAIKKSAPRSKPTAS